MSKNRNYQNYYKQPDIESPEPKTEPVITETEEAVITPTETETLEIKEEKPASTTAIVKGAGRVNLRAESNKEAKVLMTVPENTKVKILDDSNDYWFRIEALGKVGFMMSKFLKRI